MSFMLARALNLAKLDPLAISACAVRSAAPKRKQNFTISTSLAATFTGVSNGVDPPNADVVFVFSSRRHI